MASKESAGLSTVLEEEASRRTALRSLKAGAAAEAAPSPERPAVVGLALSGGGIRSATFCLGVLQALAHRRYLACFDYLSTVSGGGYIGSWLSAWIQRKGLDEVQTSLGTLPPPSGLTRAGVPPSSAEPAEVTWLRRYSNYLTPRIGLFSLDSITLVATWLRNVGLNLIVLLSCLATVFIVPLLLLEPMSYATERSAAFGFAAAWLGLLFLLAISFNLWHQSLPVDRRRNWLISVRGVVYTVVIPALLAACAAAVFLFQLRPAAAGRGPDILYVVYLLLALLAIWCIAEIFKHCGSKKTASDSQAGRQESATEPSKAAALQWEVVMHVIGGGVALVAGAGMLAGLHAAWQVFDKESETLRLALLTTFGLPATLLAFGVASSVFTGMVGRVYHERSREWWSRLNAWFAVLGGLWLAATLLAFFALPALSWLTTQVGNWIAALGTGWIASLLAALLGRVPQTASKKTQLRIDGLLNVAAAIFVAGLLFLVAAGTSAVLLRSAVSSPPDEPARTRPSVTFDFSAAEDRVQYKVSVDRPSETLFADIVRAHMADLETLRHVSFAAFVKKLAPDFMKLAEKPTADAADSLTAWLARLISKTEDGWLGAFTFLGFAALVVSLVLLLFGWRVDVNQFSLHNMYKNRLVRCYLGASNQKNRNEQPFTGLDDDDDVPLRRLAGPKPNDPVQRPFHIINTALNIAQGSNLAWQERKAASFTFTPLYCGYSLCKTQGDTTPMEQPGKDETHPAAATSIEHTQEKPSYKPTASYAAKGREERGFTLGMALATSGAAVSPNMGHSTKPALAFLLTLFNVRLGRWSPNPARDKWEHASPRFGLVCLLQELLGLSNETRNFLYLSDGGHFDNLGLYELVRRRCSVIFAVDCGADPQRRFGDLAAAIRKCRVDLGVEISIDHLELLRGDKSMRADQGFVVGTIHYEPADPSTRNGTLVLIKPTLCRAQKEPPDVLHYAAKNPPFPQQSTADQFFDESQFESYRRLGLFIGEQCVDKYGSLLPEGAISPFTPPAGAPDESPTFPTKWLAWLFFRHRSTGRQLPARAGALVDFFVLTAMLVILALGAFVVFDRMLLPGLPTGVCLSIDSCTVNAQALFDAVHGDRASAGRPLYWRTLLDNFFVLGYLGMLVMGFVLGVNRWVHPRKTRCKRWLMVGLCALALLTAGFDYAENFLLQAAIGAPTLPPQTAETLAFYTAGKFQLFGVSLAILLLLLPKIVRRFKRRWRDVLTGSGSRTSARGSAR